MAIEENSDTVCEELAAYSMATQCHVNAYRNFLERAQAFDFVGAAHCQLCAVSALEAATDAYLRACRAAQEAESRG